MNDERRLYSEPGAEHCYGSIAEVWETDIEPFRGEEQTWFVHEFSVIHPLRHVQPVDEIIESVAEFAAEEQGLEDSFDHWDTAGHAPEVVAAFEAALIAFADAVSFYRCDELVATHTITLAEDGSPLVDGQPLYVAAAPSEPTGESAP